MAMSSTGRFNIQGSKKDELTSGLKRGIWRARCGIESFRRDAKIIVAGRTKIPFAGEIAMLRADRERGSDGDIGHAIIG